MREAGFAAEAVSVPCPAVPRYPLYCIPLSSPIPEDPGGLQMPVLFSVWISVLRAQCHFTLPMPTCSKQPTLMEVFAVVGSSE